MIDTIQLIANGEYVIGLAYFNKFGYALNHSERHSDPNPIFVGFFVIKL